MSQLNLVALHRPQQPEGIDLRCCSVEALSVTGARLIHADPPWTYDNGGNQGNAADHYDLISMEEIAQHLDASYDLAAEHSYLLVWTTWPKLGEWMAAGASLRWNYLTGGVWHKTGRLGVGYHWRGDSEPLLLYRKGNPRPVTKKLSNCFAGPRTRHSEKPVPFLRSILEAWTEPDDLVVDLYAGLAPLARACAAEGRRYVGAEIDPERHLAGLTALAQMRGAS
jgi:site-specific DNA-methyltransferase (adenine-specific)